MTRIIAFGNAKGGTGKSTLAMHLAVALLNRGLKVATVDLDARQGTLSRYVANRRRFGERTGTALAHPDHTALHPAADPQADTAALIEVLERAAAPDIVIIDTPGADTDLALVGHAFADVIVTPLNDSLIDLDVIADVDPVKRTIVRPSHYAERVWKAKQMRARRDGGRIDWIVLRNRVGQLDARNKRLVARLLDDLARRIGFRVADGIAERVIFRELFLDGLTVDDLQSLAAGERLAVSHVAARQELRALLGALDVLAPLLPDMVSSAAPRSGPRALVR
ncbi:MAG: ATPase [Rhodospirillaceae bacterium]|nr:MAG: ATPase [Rhodospirillaceae bacterium]